MLHFQTNLIFFSRFPSQPSSFSLFSTLFFSTWIMSLLLFMWVNIKDEGVLLALVLRAIYISMDMMVILLEKCKDTNVYIYFYDNSSSHINLDRLSRLPLILIQMHISNLSVEESLGQIPKHRHRRYFFYRKNKGKNKSSHFAINLFSFNCFHRRERNCRYFTFHK